MILVEILPGQSPGDAIQDNIPLYNGAFLKNLYLNYPSSFRALDTGKTYAWRVVAMNGTQPAAMTDIWTFRVASVVPILKLAAKDSYVSLKSVDDPAISTTDNNLQINYENMALDTTVNYSILSLQDKGNPVVQKGTIHLNNGENFIKVALNNGFQTNKIYLFQIVNRRRETWSLKFTWTNSSSTNNNF